MDFKPNPAQQKIIDHMIKNPNKPIELRRPMPSYEMVQIAKYLKGELGEKYNADMIIFDESDPTLEQEDV